MATEFVAESKAWLINEVLTHEYDSHSFATKCGAHFTATVIILFEVESMFF